MVIKKFNTQYGSRLESCEFLLTTFYQNTGIFYNSFDLRTKTTWKLLASRYWNPPWERETLKPLKMELCDRLDTCLMNLKISHFSWCQVLCLQSAIGSELRSTEAQMLWASSSQHVTGKGTNFRHRERQQKTVAT